MSANARRQPTNPTSKPVPYLHLAWSIGHVIVLLATIWNILGLIFFKSRPAAYYLAYGGAILSWSIVVYKSLGIPSLSRGYLQRAAMDENVQYLVVAVYWFFSKPIFVSLLPFAIFSTFHSLTFARTSLLPKLPSSKKDPSGAERPIPANEQMAVTLSRTIQTWVKQNYDSAMYLVAMIEVLIIQGRVTLGAITFQNSFLHPLFFAHFLRLRYHLSPQTRTAVSTLNQSIDHYLDHPQCPPIVKKGVNIVRGLITQYASSVITTAANPPPNRTGAQSSSSATSTPR